MSNLVLGVKVGSNIRIGKDIIVSVVSASKGQAKLAINAPKSISVDREEIYLKKVANKVL